MNPIRIVVKPTKRRFGRRNRRQWQYLIVAGNNEPVSEKDTYGQVADIRDIMRKLVNSSTPVVLEIHSWRGIIKETLR